MKLATVILVIVTICPPLLAQERTFFEDTVIFFCALEKNEISGIIFDLESLDTLNHRTDSIFKSLSFHHGYWFTSYKCNGELVGMGSFHFHGTRDQKDYIETESDDFLLNSFNWTNLHVWSFANCAEQPNCDVFELYFCNGNPTDSYVIMPRGILSGSQTGWTFSEKEIRRMPGR
jgi:hypothetical protein